MRSTVTFIPQSLLSMQLQKCETGSKFATFTNDNFVPLLLFHGALEYLCYSPVFQYAFDGFTRRLCLCLPVTGLGLQLA